MRLIIILSILIISCESSNEILSEYDLKTWLRKNPVEIGCILEKKLSFKDSIFNCSYGNYINNGDPCNNVKEYYEGIVFPNELAEKIHPTIKSLDLEFEHGELREIYVEFKDSIAINEVKKILNLPKNKSSYPDNIMNVFYGENVSSIEKPINSNYTKWLSIVGFDHMGAGD